MRLIGAWPKCERGDLNPTCDRENQAFSRIATVKDHRRPSRIVPDRHNLAGADERSPDSTSGELSDQRLRRLQIGRVEAFAEPGVDVREALLRFLHTSLTLSQPAQTGRCTELPRLRALTASCVDRLQEARL